MKKKLCLMLAVMLLLLSACSRTTAPKPTMAQYFAPSKRIPVETTAEPTQPETAAPDRNDAARSAFQRALRTVHDDLRWPELPDSGNSEVWESGTIEDEQFAVTDVDGDGEEELLVSVSNTYMAGMCEIIYAYDPQTDGVRIESYSYVGVTHYPGMLKVEASHNQGMRGMSSGLTPLRIMTKRRIAIKTPSMWTHGARISPTTIPIRKRPTRMTLTPSMTAMSI